jgi:hypothetical protein
MYHRLIQEKILPGGVAADVGAAIHYVGEEIYRCVSSRKHARAYQVRLERGRVVEEAMETALLTREGRA